MTFTITKNVSSSSIIFFWTTLAALSTSVLGQWDSCPEDEEHVIFGLFTDQDSSKEQSWTLLCGDEGAELWDVSPSNWPSNVGPHQWFVTDVCVPATDTCTFTIGDTGGDGLQEGEGNGSHGYYILVRDSETIAAYDEQPFTEHVYCLGPDCTTLSLEEEDDCDLVYLGITVDNNPEEIQYSVICQEDGGGTSSTTTLWSETQLTTNQMGTTIESDEVCIQLESLCCTFSITDSGSDGLTDPTPDGTYGSVYLEVANQRLWDYDGSSLGSMFKSYTVDFGGAC